MSDKSYHEKFLIYLENLHSFNESSRHELVQLAEEYLPTLLLSNGLQTDGNIYNHLNLELWTKLDTNSLNDGTTEEDLQRASLIKKSLKLFIDFIKQEKKKKEKKLFEAQVRKERYKLKSSIEKTQSDKILDSSIPENENTARPEGSVSQVCVTHYERNPEDRQKALKKYGYVCQVCGMNFEEAYGEIGKDFIEIHHMYPVCNMGENYIFDPLDEERGLIPLCSNCHSMIHRGGRKEERNGKQVMIPLTLHELREIYQKKNKK